MPTGLTPPLGLEAEEGGAVGDPGGLLHVVGDDHDREAAFEAVHQVLDRAGGDRVERRGGLVEQQHVGLDRDRAGDAEALLLATGEAEGAVLEPVFDLVPEGGAAQGFLDPLVQAGAHTEVARRPGDVVVDRLREGVRFLEDHADPPPHLDLVDVAAVDVVAVVEDLAARSGSRGPQSFMRLRLRRKVVLPQPEGPIRAVIWPRRIFIETSVSASLAP